MGQSRPFLEAGGALTPYEDVSYSRSYANGVHWAVGNAKTIDRNLSLFARAGWIARLTPVDEAAVYGDLGRNWMQTGGYTEATSALNPFPATVPSGLDTLNVARVGGANHPSLQRQYRSQCERGGRLRLRRRAAPAVSVYGFGPIAPNAVPNTTWVEYGARLGYRYSDRLVIDAFVVGTAFGEVGVDGARRNGRALFVLSGVGGQSRSTSAYRHTCNVRVGDPLRRQYVVSCSCASTVASWASRITACSTLNLQ